MSTTINIPVEVPYGYDLSPLLAKVADYVRLFVPVTGRPTVAEVEQTDPIITEADLVIDPAVEAMFSNVPPLSPDIDIKQEYSQYPLGRICNPPATIISICNAISRTTSPYTHSSRIANPTEQSFLTR